MWKPYFPIETSLTSTQFDTECCWGKSHFCDASHFSVMVEVVWGVHVSFALQKCVPYKTTCVTEQYSWPVCLSNTYSQVLRCEGPKASQVSPGGGVVELLNLLYQLLLQAALLLISLCVCKLHHQRWGTALKQWREMLDWIRSTLKNSKIIF